MSMNALKRAAYFVLYRLALCYWFVFRPRTLGSYVAVWFDGQVLIIKNPYKSAYTIPCGGTKRGESTLEAAARELMEEVGIDLTPDQFELVGRFTSYSEFKTDDCDVFEVHMDREPKVTVDQHEVVQAEFMSVDAAYALPLTDILRQYLDTRDANDVPLQMPEVSTLSKVSPAR